MVYGELTAEGGLDFDSRNAFGKVSNVFPTSEAKVRQVNECYQMGGESAQTYAEHYASELCKCCC